MKLLIYGINFFPEMTGIGKYTSELAEWLAAEGHEVQVICGVPHYPQWKLHAGYQQRFTATKDVNPKICRVPLYVPPPGRVRALGRILLESSFTLLSLRWWLPIFFSSAKPDIVIAVYPPLQSALIPWLYSVLRGVKWVLWVQDFQVDAAFRLGMLSQGHFGKALYALEGFFLRKASWVVSISGPMCRRAIQKGARAETVVQIPNWANLDQHAMRPPSQIYRHNLGILPHHVMVVYAGAMGEKQGLEIVIEAAELLKADREIVFVLAGDGAAKPALQRIAVQRRLDNLTFLPVQSAEEFAELLAAADVQLVVQKAEAADLVMPSKLTNILASGRPCIGTANEGTALAEILQQAEAGLVIPPGNLAELVQAIARLAVDKNLRESMGRKARRYAEQNLDRSVILKKFVHHISHSKETGAATS